MTLPEIKDKILVSTKTCHKGALFAAAHYGMSTIPLSDKYTLKILKRTNDLIEIQIYQHAITASPFQQMSIPKSKAKPKKKGLTSTKKINTTIEEI